MSQNEFSDLSKNLRNMFHESFQKGKRLEKIQEARKILDGLIFFYFLSINCLF